MLARQRLNSRLLKLAQTPCARFQHSHSCEPTGPVRVRFAPSPTGFLHLGGLRTALFNYLLARRYGGQFILRIEDTDQKRFVAGATENILATLQWAGLAIDEGPGKGPDKYFQSQRTELYQKHAQLLLDSGHAYRCFCDSHRLELLRQEATVQGRAPMYDRRCLHLSQRQVDEKLRTGEPYTVRMKAPGALTEAGREVGRFSDIVHGQMEFRGPAGFDDAVLLKSDGLATYHLANVVDDHLMGITHVMRGEEWLISTPKHRALFRAFGWEPPAYAHLPLLMNSDGSKLSKRNQDGPVKNYISAGYLPQALVNYVALLGWHPDSTKEVFTMPELEQQFALRGLSRSKSAVSRDRLDWLQKQHLRAAIHDDQQVMGLAEQALAEIRGAEGAGREGLTSEAVVGALRLCGDRLARAGDLHTTAPYLFGDPDLKSEQARGFALKVPREIQLRVLRQALAQVSAMAAQPGFNAADAASWHGLPKSLSRELDVPAKHPNMMLRYALTGQPTGPALADLMAYLPVASIEHRLARALEVLESTQ